MVNTGYAGDFIVLYRIDRISDHLWQYWLVNGI